MRGGKGGEGRGEAVRAGAPLKAHTAGEDPGGGEGPSCLLQLTWSSRLRAVLPAPCCAGVQGVCGAVAGGLILSHGERLSCEHVPS